MALLKLRCANGHEWDALKSFSTHDPDAERCPTCFSTEVETMVSGSGFGIRGAVPDKDIPSLMDNKRYLEANSERILSGELTVAERGPREYRPEMPSHLRKHF